MFVPANSSWCENNKHLRWALLACWLINQLKGLLFTDLFCSLFLFLFLSLVSVSLDDLWHDVIQVGQFLLGEDEVHELPDKHHPDHLRDIDGERTEFYCDTREKMMSKRKETEGKDSSEHNTEYRVEWSIMVRDALWVQRRIMHYG